MINNMSETNWKKDEERLQALKLKKIKRQTAEEYDSKYGGTFTSYFEGGEYRVKHSPASAEVSLNTHQKEVINASRT